MNDSFANERVLTIETSRRSHASNYRTNQKTKIAESKEARLDILRRKNSRDGDGSIDNTHQNELKEPPKQRIVHYTQLLVLTYFIYCPHTNFKQNRNGSHSKGAICIREAPAPDGIVIGRSV